MILGQKSKTSNPEERKKSGFQVIKQNKSIGSNIYMLPGRNGYKLQ